MKMKNTFERRIEGQESVKNKELLRIAKESITTIVHGNGFLEAVHDNRLDREQWRMFAIQRYLAAASFESLLQVGIETATEAPLPELARELQNNLDDETGVNRETGAYAESESHETWRKNFYEALGISTEDLREDGDMLPGGRAYQSVVAGIVDRADVFEIAGALFALEASIPGEFFKIRRGRDEAYPDQFVVQQGDTADISATKRKARRYIDDHIVHDSKVHYPELLHALDDSIRTPEDLERVQVGADAVAKARRAFYDELSATFLET
jgi:pyrroloquinoline quinone (PQQ) biosynthesis protein C